MPAKTPREDGENGKFAKSVFCRSLKRQIPAKTPPPGGVVIILDSADEAQVSVFQSSNSGLWQAGQLSGGPHLEKCLGRTPGKCSISAKTIKAVSSDLSFDGTKEEGGRRKRRTRRHSTIN